MICMCRGSTFSTRSTGHFSSASGNTVWFVNENTRVVMSHALVHPRPCSSINSRISSGTPIVGCVSFSCSATFSGNSSNESLCVTR